MKKTLLFATFCTAVLGAVAFGQTNTEAKIKSVPAVALPPEATKTGLAGEVRVKVEIDETGKVTKLYDASGPDWVCPDVNRPDVTAMRAIATKAAESAIFSPAVQDGKPVPSQTFLRFNFVNPAKPQAGLGTSGGYRLAGVGGSPDLTKAPEPSTATKDTNVISGGVLGGTGMSLPQPAYPAAARALRASGAVGVQVLIDTNGTVFTAKAISGHPLLQSAARLAACKARFAPTLLSGQPVMISGIVNYNFVP